jgi:hypothetical protein
MLTAGVTPTADVAAIMCGGFVDGTLKFIAVCGAP